MIDTFKINYLIGLLRGKTYEKRYAPLLPIIERLEKELDKLNALNGINNIWLGGEDNEVL
jgi:hypothetical protein